MLNSTAHWQPLVNGYSDHIPADFRRNVVPLSSFPTRESFSILSAVGARYVVFHLDMYDTRSRARADRAPRRAIPRISVRSRKKVRCGSTRSSAGPTRQWPAAGGPVTGGPDYWLLATGCPRETYRALTAASVRFIDSRAMRSMMGAATTRIAQGISRLSVTESSCTMTPPLTAS